MVINDYTTGYYGALAIQVALLRQLKEGGGYLLSPSLTGTAISILRHFKSSELHSFQGSQDAASPPGTLEGWTGYGYLKTLETFASDTQDADQVRSCSSCAHGVKPTILSRVSRDCDRCHPNAASLEIRFFFSDVGMPFLQKLTYVARIGKKWINNTSSI